MALSTRFRDLRVRAGLTKTALAKPRYTVSYVSQIEAGRRHPSTEALRFFSHQLGVTPDFLATGVPEGTEHAIRYALEASRTSLREGRSADAEREARQALEQSELYDLEPLRSLALCCLGAAQVPLGHVREAIDVLERATAGDLPARDRGMAVAALARAYRAVGDLAYAVDLVESFLGRGDGAPHDPDVLADLHTVLVSVYFERGDVVRAERAAARALAAADLGAGLEVRAKTFWDASRVMAEARRFDDALELATRARVIMEELDDRRRIARLHNAYAFICLEADPPRTREAASHLDLAEQELEEGGTGQDLAYVYSERSRLELLEGRPEQAVAQADRALAAVGSDELERARCLFLKGRALAMLKRTDEAGRFLSEAAEVFAGQGSRQQEAACWRELGELDLAAGNVDGAVEALRAGLRALDPRRSRA